VEITSGRAINQMYTGRPPFSGLTDSEVIHKVVVKKESPGLPPNAPSELKEVWSILKKCWSQDPRLRPGPSEIANNVLKASLQSIKNRPRLESRLVPLSSKLFQLARGKKDPPLGADAQFRLFPPYEIYLQIDNQIKILGSDAIERQPKPSRLIPRNEAKILLLGPNEQENVRSVSL
jgi:serine/threonine protein kinase